MRRRIAFSPQDLCRGQTVCNSASQLCPAAPAPKPAATPPPVKTSAIPSTPEFAAMDLLMDVVNKVPKSEAATQALAAIQTLFDDLSKANKSKPAAAAGTATGVAGQAAAKAPMQHGLATEKGWPASKALDLQAAVGPPEKAFISGTGATVAADVGNGHFIDMYTGKVCHMNADGYLEPGLPPNPTPAKKQLPGKSTSWGMTPDEAAQLLALADKGVVSKKTLLDALGVESPPPLFATPATYKKSGYHLPKDWGAVLDPKAAASLWQERVGLLRHFEEQMLAGMAVGGGLTTSQLHALTAGPASAQSASHSYEKFKAQLQQEPLPMTQAPPKNEPAAGFLRDMLDVYKGGGNSYVDPRVALCDFD